MIRFLLSISVFALCLPAEAEIVIPLSVYSVTTHRAQDVLVRFIIRDHPLSEVEGLPQLLLLFAIPPFAIP